jgi:hypothetical protein
MGFGHGLRQRLMSNGFPGKRGISIESRSAHTNKLFFDFYQWRIHPRWMGVGANRIGDYPGHAG